MNPANNIPNPDQLKQLSKKYTSQEITILWLISVLIKNRRVRTTSEMAAESFMSKGYTVSKEENAFLIEMP